VAEIRNTSMRQCGTGDEPHGSMFRIPKSQKNKTSTTEGGLYIYYVVSIDRVPTKKKTINDCPSEQEVWRSAYYLNAGVGPIS
jgi:hypothetical protein